MDFLKDFFNMIDSDVVFDKTTIRNIAKDITDLGESNYDSAIMYYDLLKEDKDLTLSKKIMNSDIGRVLKNVGLLKTNDEKKVKDSVKALATVSKEMIYLSNELKSKIDEDYLTKDGMSERDKVIIKTLTDILNAENYIKELLLVLSYIDDDEMYYSVKYKETMEYLTKEYAVLSLFVSKKPNEILKIINDANKEFSKEITRSVHTSILGRLKTKFTGNPVLFLGLWWEGIQHDRYEENKDQAALTRLKIMELKSKMLKGDDESIKKSIEYYEEKLSDLEYKIKLYQEG